MANKRIYYAVHQAGITADGSGVFTEVHGLQTIGINTNFELDQVFELGQLSLYENIENIPDMEVTMEKVLDGYPLVYHLATYPSASATLAGRSVAKSIVALSIFSDAQNAASGAPLSEVEMSGMFVSSMTYTMPVEGNATEATTLVGNNKVWRTASFKFTGAFDNTDEPLSLTQDSGGVQRREDVIFAPLGTGSYDGGGGDQPARDINGAVDTDLITLLPSDIDGISSSGTNDVDSAGDFGAHIQTITTSTDLGRDELFELGRKGPYHRFVNFPVEVTCEIEVISVQGDLVSATEAGVLGNGNNLANETIKIRMREGTFLDLGTKNKLTTVNYTGGDAGGGNVTLTYSYTNFNDLTITHPQDPSGL